eukprot:CAMPEP_0172326850 /NCGR_PEP_ID=MMETSP1058-20130122/57785_1 /TAXON_ID=83371 /ORGANISM="Detonula confervacea, Strain CCMP 353" /LENGTH=601 /DNA_ID=CAMNT_0013043739 /DNA_START=176 /DNA_END=1981 /DNA_ORIENTATION=+
MGRLGSTHASQKENPTADNNGKVIVVGSINQDLTTYATSLPTPGQTILGSDFITTAGGKGANQAVAASSIGVVDQTVGGVHMIGRVGNDDMGRGLVSGLQSKGVKLNESETRVAGAHTGVASINVDLNTGQNTIVVAPGANLELSSDDVKSSLADLLSDGDKQRRDVVLVQLEIKPETALQTLTSASKLGALTILNPAPAPKGWELTEDWYSSIDILIPNETELASLCGVSNSEDVTGEGEEAMAKSLLERGVRHAVIVTLGARGAMIVRRKHYANVESSSNAPDNSNIDNNLQTIMISEPSDLPCKFQPVVDAVGAGDAFCGALAAYLSRGIHLDQAASMACGVASMSVRKRGAQTSYPEAEDLPDCLRLDSVLTNDVVDNEESISIGQPRSTITFVTGNKNKLAEVQRLLSTSSASDETPSIPFDIDNMKLDLPELQGSPRDIASEKCKTASQQLQTAVLTEDTCLCFRGLNDLPGPYIKWFLEDLGHDGLNKLLQGFDDDRAYAQTIIAFSPGPGKEVQLFEGQTEGRIVPARGSLDFGWDPIFEPTEEEQGSNDGLRKTYAEMTKDEKNAISHRGRAFYKFHEYLLSQSDAILEDMS